MLTNRTAQAAMLNQTNRRHSPLNLGARDGARPKPRSTLLRIKAK